MNDDLIKRLLDGVIEHDKRWSGDTHDDLGGSANYEATDGLMSEAAAALSEAQATIARLEAALREIAEMRDYQLPKAQDRARAALSPREGEG